MEAHELTGLVTEPRGRDHIHHDVDESIGRERDDERGREDAERRRAPSTAISKPQITSERVIVTLAPKRSLIAPPNAATTVAAKIPAPSSKPSWASLMPNECWISTVATAHAPPKKPSVTKAAATGPERRAHAVLRAANARRAGDLRHRGRAAYRLE